MNPIDNWHQICRDEDYYVEREGDHHKGPAQARTKDFHCGPEGQGSEFETTNLLRSLVMAMKPKHLLETGCEQAHGTVAMASGCQFNGFGHVTTIDKCALANSKGPSRAHRAGVDKFITFEHMTTQEFVEQYDGPPFDFAFFDCDVPERVTTARAFYDKGLLSNFIMFHDVGVWHPRAVKYIGEINEFAQDLNNHDGLSGIQNTLARGWRMMQVKTIKKSMPIPVEEYS